MDFRQKELIDRDNKRVLCMMRSGMKLGIVPPESTWFPPRPKIKKDPNALEFVHKKKPPLKLAD